MSHGELTAMVIVLLVMILLLTVRDALIESRIKRLEDERDRAA